MRITGIEPARLLTLEPKSSASASSAISASGKYYTMIFKHLSINSIVRAAHVCFFIQRLYPILTMFSSLSLSVSSSLTCSASISHPSDDCKSLRLYSNILSLSKHLHMYSLPSLTTPAPLSMELNILS